jgi:hypothetical protein
MTYQFDQNDVEIINDTTGNGLMFQKDGKTFSITQQAYIWDKETYRANLRCDDDECYGYVVWQISEQDCEDESHACDWDKFDVYA